MRSVRNDGSTATEHVSEKLNRDLRRRGSVITSLFAFAWAVGVRGFASMAAQLIVPVVALAVTVATVVFALRRTATQPETQTRRLPSDWQRRYNLLGLGQLVAIVLAIIALVTLGVPTLIPAVVCLVVGIHFFPLSRIFDQSQYVWTGAALCGIAVLGAASLTAANEEASRAVVGFGAATILWATSAHLTSRG